MRYTELLYWGIITLLCVLLFIPFIVAQGGVFPNMFFPFITGKNFAFRILVEVMLGLYILLALRDPKYRPRGSVLFYSVLAFVAWVGLATIFSVDPVKSFWSNFERMEGYIGLLHTAALFIVAGAVLTAREWWNNFFKVSIFVASLQGMYALFQILGWATISTQSGARVDTSFGNATYLAVYMLFNIFLTLFILAREKQSRALQSLYGIALVLHVVALFFTQTRGALLGFIGGFVIAMLYVAWKGRGPLRTWAVGGLISIAILAVGFIAVRDTEFIRNSPLNRLASISFADKTTQARFLIWGMAYQGFTEKPLLGWGQENFSYVFNKYYNPGMYSQEQWFDRAHNEFIDWLLAAGLPAFILFLSFFFTAAWIIFRSNLEVPAQAVLFGLLAGYGFHSMFVFDNLISAMYFFLLLAFIQSLTPRQVPRWLFLSRPLSEHGVAIAAPAVVVAVVGAIWFFNVPGISNAKTLINAITTQQQVVQNGAVTTIARDPKENLAVFERILAGGALGRQEVMEQLFQFSSSLGGNTSISPEVKQQAYELTRREGDAVLAARPGDARLELFLATFLNQYNMHEEAFAHYLRALEFSPNKQQILFQAGFTKIALGDTVGALEFFKRAFDAEPSYEDARVLYAMALYTNNQNTLADQVLTEGFGSVVVDNERLLQFYSSRKMYDRVIGIWQKRVEAKPNDAQTRVGLASIYFAMGDIVNTIATLRKAAEVEPAVAAEVQNLITQIQNGTLKPAQ